MADSFTTRLADPSDQPGIIELIDSVYQEYGDRICLTGADQDLLDLKGSYFDQDGAFWVVEDSKGAIVGTHAAKPISNPQTEGASQHTTCTFRRLYLKRTLRGAQLGSDLMKLTLQWASENGFNRVEFWSDTRFERAHRFFSKLGFQKTSAIRHLDDGIAPYSEFLFFIDL